MIDFATVKSLEIPEGKVTKIADASGRVLWSAVKLANLTITSFWDGMDGDTARITVNSPSPFAPNPNEPNNKVTSWTAYVYDLFDQQNRTIKIPVGSTIECYITRDKGNADSYIKLNGVNVTTGEGTYVYTVTGDATIDVSEEYIQGDFGVISIVGAVTYISFTMNGETYQTIEGMTWNAWFTSDYNTTGKGKGSVKNIKDASGNETSINAVIVSGTTYQITFSKPLGEYAVGETVPLNVSGVSKEFIVVQQGLPSTMYDSSCDGTWLLMKDIYTECQWKSNSHNYGNSDIHSYLQNTFINLFDTDIKNTIKTVKLPYSSAYDVVQSGANGLSAKVFSLSLVEIYKLETSDYLINSTYDSHIDGERLQYFKVSESNAETRRVALYNGSAASWWTRSTNKSPTVSAKMVKADGGTTYDLIDNSHGVRPAIILPSDYEI